MATVLIRSSRGHIFRIRRGLALTPYATGVVLDDIEVDIETTEEAARALLPETIEMTLSNGNTETLDVLEWLNEDYSQHHTGDYVFTAVYEELPDYLWQKRPMVTVTVKVGLPLTSSDYYLASDDNLIIE